MAHAEMCSVASGFLDAMMQTWKTKSGKILRIFRYRVRAVTILPPLQESRPEILGLSEKGGIFLSKASFSLPSGFFFGMVRPLDLEKLDGLVAGFPLRFIQDADRMLAIGQILLNVQCLMINPTDGILEATTELGNMEHIMDIREIGGQLKLIGEISSLG